MEVEPSAIEEEGKIVASSRTTRNRELRKKLHGKKNKG
jgi:hypothetical protein